MKKYITDVDLWQYDDDYPSNITDVPRIRITHFKNGKTKNVVGDLKRPEAIKKLEQFRPHPDVEASVLMETMRLRDFVVGEDSISCVLVVAANIALRLLTPPAEEEKEVQS